MNKGFYFSTGVGDRSCGLHFQGVAINTSEYPPCVRHPATFCFIFVCYFILPESNSPELDTVSF